MRWTRELGGHLALLRSAARRLVVAALGGLCPRAPARDEVSGPILSRQASEALRFDDLTEAVAFDSRTERIAYESQSGPGWA
jgi:hypothetical protein